MTEQMDSLEKALAGILSREDELRHKSGREPYDAGSNIKMPAEMKSSAGIR